MTIAGRARLQAWLQESKTANLLSQTGFQRLYAATSISTVGDSLYFIGVTWLAYDLTGSTVFTGLAVALTRIPAIASVLIGPLVDRAPLGRLLPAVEIVQAVVVLIVPIAHLLNQLSVWLVLAVVTVVATLQRVSAPAAQAVLPRIVDDSLLPRANSLTSATHQTISALAEAVSGALIAIVGAVSLFLFDTITFVMSAVLLLALYVPPAGDNRGDPTSETGEQNDEPQRDMEATPNDSPPPEDRSQSQADNGQESESDGIPSLNEYLSDIREGVATIRNSTLVYALGGAMLANLGTGLSTAVLPAFGDALGGASAYGLLVAAATGGTLLGSTVAAQFEDYPFGAIVITGFAFAALGRIGAAIAEFPALVYLAFGASAIPVGVYNVLVSTVIQVGVPDRLLARVSSTNGTLMAIVGPGGLLLGGVLGSRIPAATVVGLSAVGYLLISGYWLLIPRLRGFEPVTKIEAGAFAPT